ncbi:site-2 protease family protein, partial [Planctomycetota bacterium]
LTGGLLTTLWIACLFGSVAAHELGHALAALGYGIRTRAITLLPIGGVAMLERDLRVPRHEFVVALAGPLVNVMIAALLALTERLLAGVLAPSAGIFALTSWALTINLALAIFNLIPAFPMDGGRVLRAHLATRMGRLRGTRIAARVGLVVAVLIGILGLFGNPMLVLIALFVYLAAQAELRRVEAEHAIGGGGGPGGWFLHGPGHTSPRFFRVEIHPPGYRSAR